MGCIASKNVASYRWTNGPRPSTIASCVVRLRRLEHALEIGIGEAAGQRLHAVGGGRLVEGVVDLDGREPLGVVAQPVRAVDGLRVERSDPVVVGPARGADEDLGHR
jgi:hypothetical protein